jgi:hypothetical protein
LEITFGLRSGKDRLAMLPPRRGVP